MINPSVTVAFRRQLLSETTVNIHNVYMIYTYLRLTFNGNLVYKKERYTCLEDVLDLERNLMMFYLTE